MAQPDRRRHQLALLAVMLVASASLALGSPSASAYTGVFTSTTPIYTGDNLMGGGNQTDFAVPGTGDVGAAGLYPSPVTVTQAATVLDVDVTIVDLTSTAPGDLNILVVGPGGQQALIMSDVGAGNDVSSVTFTLDDDTPNVLGDGVIVDFNRYQPQNQGGDGEFFPAPAPPLDGNSALSVFDGTSAAGVWNLYVVDDQTGDVAAISGWELAIRGGTRPYPSTIHVSGLPPISDVNVTLTGITTTLLADLNLLLVGPGGQQSFLMGDAGGGDDIVDVDVTIDDEAAVPLPSSAAVVDGGVYRPAWYQPRTFPAPAPAVTGSTPLSVFDGLDPDGDWQLYAVDHAHGDLASFDGWSLEFTWPDTLPPTGWVSISGDAGTTASRDVMLGLAADDAGGTGVASVRLSNDGIVFSPYQPFATSLAWTLTAGDGSKRVYAQFKDVAGNESTIVSDSITLDTHSTNPDSTGPRAVKLTPRKKATDVVTTARVKVKASEALRKGTVSTRTVFLKEKGVTGKVPARLTYRRAERTLVISPRSPLDRHTTYVVTVRRVKDRAGNAWDQKPTKSGAQPLKYSFTTG